MFCTSYKEPPMKQRALFLLSALLLILTLPVRAAETNAQPNIVFILVDDIRWDAFGCMGHPFVKTLNIDGKVSRVEGYITDILNSRAVEFVKQEHKKPFCLYVGHKAVHGPFTPAERHKDLYTKEQMPHPPSIDDDLAGKPVLTRKEQ